MRCVAGRARIFAAVPGLNLCVAARAGSCCVRRSVRCVATDAGRMARDAVRCERGFPLVAARARGNRRRRSIVRLVAAHAGRVSGGL